ncbi:MAG: sensor histidine kinase [Neobacillus sp.]
MKNSTNLPKQERRARLFILIISVIGGLIFLQQGLFKLPIPNNVVILGLLVTFLFIVEWYPLPVWKGTVTISFPLVYAIYVMEGLAYCIVFYALTIGLINAIKRRPLRIVFFNPALLILSFYVAYLVSHALLFEFPFENRTRVVQGIFQCTITILPFYIINNLIVDIVHLLRPQPYNLKVWRQKTLQELNSLCIAMSYLVLFHILGNQNRGQIDGFAFFFFFSPLVCFALLSSIIANLKKEKSKLKALFSISSELNKKIAAQDWLSFLTSNLEEFIEVDAWVLWKKEEGSWALKHSSGLVKGNQTLSTDTLNHFDQINQLLIYHDTKKAGGPASNKFKEDIGSILYAPLILDKEIVGLFVFGRIRTKSFLEEDMQSAATLANQLAVLIKNRWLIAEQEKRIILEERNRIARDIHDGVAQSLAGAIMNLDTAQRKFMKFPDDSLKLVIESTDKLRNSLREVRESIYALRPYPTERKGLLPAMEAKIQTFGRENRIAITLETRGPVFELSPMVEKIIFDIFQESTQNAIKHAQASKIDILVSYRKENVLLKVKDNGKGFSLFQAMIKARNHPHFGILHMNEAAEKIHASLQLDSKEGLGTEITLSVPRMGIEGERLNDQAHVGG